MGFLARQTSVQINIYYICKTNNVYMYIFFTMCFTDTYLKSEPMLENHLTTKRNDKSLHAYSIDESWKHYAEWKKPDTRHLLHDSVYMKHSERVNPQKRVRKVVVAGGWGGVAGEGLLRGHRVLFGGSETVQRLDGGDSCTTMCTDCHELYIWKWFVLC